jgi:hypothetical protein
MPKGFNQCIRGLVAPATAEKMLHCLDAADIVLGALSRLYDFDVEEVDSNCYYCGGYSPALYVSMLLYGNGIHNAARCLAFYSTESDCTINLKSV